MKKVLCIIILLVGAISLTGCVYTDGQRQSVYQGGTTTLGALAGQAIGRDTKSTLIGAGAGYIVGGLTKEFAYPRQETVVVQQQYNAPPPPRTIVVREYYQPEPVYQHQYRGRVGYIPPPRLMPPTGNARQWAKSPRDRAYYGAKDRIYRQEYSRWEREQRAIGRAEGELEAYRNRFFYRH